MASNKWHWVEGAWLQSSGTETYDRRLTNSSLSHCVCHRYPDTIPQMLGIARCACHPDPSLRPNNSELPTGKQKASRCCQGLTASSCLPKVRSIISNHVSADMVTYLP